MKSIIVAGTARSGTTWIGQIIQSASGLPSVFEPLHPKHVPEACDIAYRYLRPGRKNLEIEKFLRKILKGGLRRPWTDQENPRGWYKHHPRGMTRGSRIIKMIRANLMLGWLSESFGYPIVYILRHPCAVAASWKHLDWEPYLDRYIEQDELVEDYLIPFMDYVKSTSQPVEKIAAAWCIENLVPLRQIAGKNWVLCTYEDLFVNTAMEVKRILEKLGLKWSSSLENSINRHARSTNKQSAISKGKNPLTKWQDDLQGEEVNAVTSMLTSFGIDIYGDGTMPDINALNSWIMGTHKGGINEAP